MDPQIGTAEANASNARQTSDKPTVGALPTGASSVAQDTHYNPFEGTPEPAVKQSVTEQAVAAPAQHRQPVLSTVESELPPFTLADLSATTSDMTALSNQPSLTGTHNANVISGSAQVVELNPFLDSATEHISPTPVTAAAVSQHQPSSSPHAQTNPSDGDAQHVGFNPYLNSAPGQGSSATAVASTTAQPATADIQSQSQAAEAQHTAASNHQPMSGHNSKDNSQTAQHSAFFDHHPTSTHASTSNSPVQLPRTHHVDPSDPAQVTADRFYSAVLNQQGSGDFADFHSADAEDNDMGSPRAGPVPNQATHQEAQGQPAHSVASVAFQSSNNDVVDFSQAAPDAGSLSEHRPVTASQAAAAHTSASLTTPQHLDQDAATLSGQTAPSADSDAEATATATSSQANTDAAPADTTDVIAPATGSTPAEQAQALEQAPAHSFEATIEDSVGTNTYNVASSSTSVPSTASTGGHSTAQHTLQDTVEHHGKQDTAGLAHGPAHELVDNGVAKFAEVAAPAATSTTALEEILPSQASLNEELADNDFAAFPQAPTPAAASTAAQDKPVPSQAPESGHSVDDGFAQFAEVPRAAATSRPADEDALPSQASLDEELADDGFADFTDAPAASSTLAQEKAVPSEPTRNDGVSGAEAPRSATTSTPAAEAALPSQAAMDEELADDSFADFADAPSTAPQKNTVPSPAPENGDAVDDSFANFADAPVPATLSTAVSDNALPSQEAVDEALSSPLAATAEAPADHSHAQPAGMIVCDYYEENRGKQLQINV